MQKWEYLKILIWEEGAFEEMKIKKCIMNGKDMKYKAKTTHELLNELGRSGWELVGYTHGDYRDAMIMKHPL